MLTAIAAENTESVLINHRKIFESEVDIMKNMEIKTNTKELIAVIGMAGSCVYENDAEIMKKVRENFSDTEFMYIVAELSARVMDHLTGENPLDEDLLLIAQYVTSDLFSDDEQEG